MATVKKKNEVRQKPILENKETKTPDSNVSEVVVEVKAESTAETETAAENTVTPKREIAKSRKRTPLREFAHINNIRTEVVAGFQVWIDLNNKGSYHFDDEWATLFDEYNNREIIKRR